MALGAFVFGFRNQSGASNLIVDDLALKGVHGLQRHGFAGFLDLVNLLVREFLQLVTAAAS